jgi:hypothetical protein
MRPKPYCLETNSLIESAGYDCYDEIMLYSDMVSKQTTHPLAPTGLHTIEPYLAEARTLVSLIQKRPFTGTATRLVASFVALAEGDTMTGLLAYYLWRGAAQHQPARRYRQGQRWSARPPSKHEVIGVTSGCAQQR